MEEELQKAFARLKKRGVETFPAKVVSVDKNKGICVVEADGLEYNDVQLSATVEENGKRFFLFPKVESFVFVSPVEEDLHRLYVEFFSEVDELDFKTEKSQIRINDEGFLLKKDAETLAKLMSDLLKEIQAMKFTTNTGSTILLVNKPNFMAIENRFKQFLKED